MSDQNIQREHFAFLRSYWEQIKLLPSKKQKSEVFEAICSAQFFEKDINSISFSNQNQMILWEGLKPILKQSQKGYADKMGLQGSNPKQGGSKAPTEHKDKEEDKDKEFKREGERGSVFYALSENQKLKEIDLYLDHLIDESEYIKSESGFKLKIKRKFEKEDKHQLEDFEKWYLKKECDIFKSKYLGKYIDDMQIEDIYPYFVTDGYDPSWKFIISYSNKDYNPTIFKSQNEIKDFLEDEATDEII